MPVDLVSGAIGASISCLVLQPLDVIKTRLQEEQLKKNASASKRIPYVIRNILETKGIFGVWQGVTPTLLRNVPGSAVYFATLAQLRYLAIIFEHRWPSPITKSMIDPKTAKPTDLGNAIIGGTSRALAGLLFMPTTVLKVRFESSKYSYSSIPTACHNIWTKEGFAGFFRGYTATLLRDAPHSAIYVASYERLKRAIRFPKDVSPVLCNLSAGIVAGLMATLITHPFDLIKTRVQLEPKLYPSFWKTVHLVATNEGIRGFFGGFGPRILRKTLSSAITWAIYDELSSR